VEKYPPSLQFLLMTLGGIFILLAVADAKIWGGVGRILEIYGRVPLFFYILHLFAIHLAAGLLGYLTHQPVSWLFHGGFFLNYAPDGQPYGMGWRWCVGRGLRLSCCFVFLARGLRGSRGASGLAVAVFVNVHRLLACPQFRIARASM